jgi:hypothetical protein
VVFVAGGAAIGLAGYLTGAEVWNPVLAAWTYAGDLLVFGALAVLFPVAVVTRSPRVRARRPPLAARRPRKGGRAQAGLRRGPGPPGRVGGRTEAVTA